jgi:hypothetical protein
MCEIKTKICSACSNELPITEYYKKDKYRIESWCKKCHNKKRDIRRKLKMKSDPEYRKKINRKNYERRKKRYKKDKLYNLKIKLRSGIRKRIKKSGYTKKSST